MRSIFLAPFLFALSLIPALHAEKTHQSDSIAPESGISSFVNDTVNVIFGSMHDQSVDLLVPGPTPLHLKRSYNSEAIFNNWMGTAAMSTNYSTSVQGLVTHPDQYMEMVAEIQGGSLVRFISKVNPKEMDFYLHPEVIHKGLTNYGSGEISGRTNLKNIRYTLTQKRNKGAFKSGLWTAKLGDGTTRRYYKTTYMNACMNMEEERRPNGNKLIYSYHHDGNLKKIEMKDSHEKHTLNWLTFDYDKKHKKAAITTSNGKTAEYSFFERDDPNPYAVNVRYVEKVTSSDMPTVRYGYTKLNEKRLISSIEKPEGRFLEIEYNKTGKVIAQKAPAGKNGEKRTIYTFEYKPKEYHTNVRDANNHKTLYRYSHKKRLTCVDEFLKKDGFYRGDHLHWGDKEKSARGKRDDSDEGHLRARSLVREDGRVVQSFSYTYDSHGNVIQEDLYGSLTGKNPHSFTIYDSGVPKQSDIELFRKKYTYSHDGFNLLLSQKEYCGPTITYQYKP
ncbi:MAG: hypothetical protein JWO53_1127, partial [Chlamydiia bacterium]|nr:hypothetical protein [Chlamydiia bacterium]